MKRKKSSEAKSRKRKNPFLDLQSAAFPAASENEHNEVLSQVLLFSEASNQKQQKEDSKELTETVSLLIEYLDKREAPSGQSRRAMLSPTDIATMLLQWAVKKLVYASNYSKSASLLSHDSLFLYWKTLRTCLSVLASTSNDASANISNCLSQSTLHKLVPFSAQAAINEHKESAAMCFVLLVDHFYRPTIDLACQSLVPLVDKLVVEASSIENCRHDEIPLSTVRLLKRLQKTSNPKKVFQLLSEPKVLSALSRWKLLDDTDSSWKGNRNLDTTIRELFNEGLFSPLYHFEGFRGLTLAVPSITDSSKRDTENTIAKTQKSHHCYQETLLDIVTQLIGEAGDIESLVSVALLVPDLLNGMIEMFSSWERNSAAKLKKKGSRDLTPLQFRLWSNLVYPMVLKLHKGPISASHSTLILLRSLRETLALVLKHNLYLPSHRDEGNFCFTFLETLATTFINSLNAMNELEASDEIARVESECHQGLELLLRLNHLVAHERLRFLLASCGRTHSSLNQQECAFVGTSQRDLVLVIIQTYHRLRQLDHLFQSLLEAASLAQGPGGEALKLLISENRVRQEISTAVTNCPPNQVKDLFDILNLWIQNRAKLPADSSGSLPFAASMFVILIQSVRVDKHTSVDISALCDESIEKAVLPLIRSPSNRTLKREGLTLTGWLLDLKNRCAFWLDHLEDINKETTDEIVSTILNESGLSNILTEGEAMPEYANEIQSLLLHRIRKLHTEIYKEQCREIISQKENILESSLVKEARQLVQVVIGISEGNKATATPVSALSSDSRAWKPIAEAVSYWAPYSEPNQVKSFLSWLFTTMSLSEQTLPNIERLVAEALLCDMSFFEIPEIAAQFHHIGIQCVLNLLKSSVTKNSSKASKSIEGVSFQGLDLTSNPCQHTLDDLCSVMSGITPVHTKKSLKGLVIRTNQLEQAMRIFQVLNGVPLSPNTNLNWCLVIQLDALLSAFSLACSASDVNSAIIPLLCTSRTYMGAVMAGRLDVVDNQAFPSFVRGFVKLTTEVTHVVSSAGERIRLFKASESVVESIATSCVSVFHQNPKPLKSLIEYFDSFIQSERDREDIDQSVVINLSRALVKRLVVCCQRGPILKDFETLHVIVSPFVAVIRDACARKVKPTPHTEYVRAELLLLAGDIERLSALMIDSVPSVTLPVSVVEDALESSSDVVRKAAIYNLGCTVASGHIAPSSYEIVVDKCLSDPNQILLSTFCSLARTMDADETERLLKRLLFEARAQTDRKLHVINLFHLVVENAKQATSRLAISRFARAFFAISVDLLHPFRRGTDFCSWASECNLAISLLIALTENKDIISIRERDLAFLLVQVSSLLGSVQEAADVDERIFASCFTLISSLLQRFPKQLYACAPTVISIIHVLLRHALYVEVSRKESTKRAQMVTRLCELLVPHRDVYKKHVLALILEYVGAMKSGTHPSRSKALVPAIYCLLDMLSQFETEQLNTMMDNTSKALFRSVYQSHHKTHMYKGQY